MYDPLVKVPLIVKWPHQRGRLPGLPAAGKQRRSAPTLCLAAGLQPRTKCVAKIWGSGSQGREISSAVRGRTGSWPGRERIKLLLTAIRRSSIVLRPSSRPVGVTQSQRIPGISKTRSDALTAAIAAWRPQPVSPRYVIFRHRRSVGQRPPPGLAHRQQIIDHYQSKMQASRKR